MRLEQRLTLLDFIISQSQNGELVGRTGNSDPIYFFLLKEERMLQKKCHGLALLVLLSAFVLVQNGFGSDYCPSRGNYTSYEWIQSVSVGSYSNSSGRNYGYLDRTTDIIELSPGVISVTLSPGFGYGSYTEYWKIWIDFNHDLSFSADEAVFTSSSNSSITSSFTIPESAIEGVTGMRISMKYGGVPPACGSFTYGEVEDYSVNISQTAPHMPEVVEVFPVNDTSAVDVTTTISAVFDSDIDIATINSDTFLVSNGTAFIDGAVSYDAVSRIAQFQPSADLEYLTGYAVTLTTGVTDIVGNPLSENYYWQFTTMENPYLPPVIIDIYPEIDDTNIQVSKSIMVTFDKEMDESTINASTFVLSDGTSMVNGDVTAGTGGKIFFFTPTAYLDYDTSYTVTLSDEIKDALGNSLQQPYIWTFTTQPEYTSQYCYSAANSSADEWIDLVQVNGIINESDGDKYQNFSHIVFPLNEDVTPISFSMAGGALSPAEYWNVWIDWNQDGDYDDDHETVLSRTTNQNSPTASGSITIPALALSGNTGMRVSMKWNAYPGSCETFPFGEVEDYTVAVPSIPPQVIGITPENEAQNVEPATTVEVLFSKAMDGQTIDNETFRVHHSAGNIEGTVAYDASTNSATFTPADTLDYETQYTVTLTTGVRDIEGLYLASEFNSSFTTESLIPPPEVVSTFPWDTQTYIMLNSQISIEFSKAMDVSTITTDNIIVSDGVNINPVGGYFWYNDYNNRAVFEHMENFSANTVYYVTVTTGIKDAQGIALPQEYSFSFTTTPNAAPVYCTPCANTSSDAWISKVEMGTQFHSSYQEGCDYFYNTAFQLNSTSSTKLTVTASFSGSPTGQYFKAWIDWDHDGTFNDANEQVMYMYGTTVYAYISIPENAVSGTTRLRIAMQKWSPPELCQQIDSGEIEDYDVIIP